MLLKNIYKKKVITTRVLTSRVFSNYIDLLKKIDNARILDIGYICGKNIEIFIKEGFTIYVEDYLTSLETKKIKTKNYGERCIYEFKKFTYPEDYFDGIICWDVFDYLDVDYSNWLINEISKLMKPKGLLFCLFDSKRPDKSERFRKKIVIYDRNHLLYNETEFWRIFFSYYENRDIFSLLKNFNILETYYMKDGMREILAKKTISSL